MSEWAQLSASQRARARLNFNEVRRVPTDEKRAKWEQYQALPEQERERLASDRPKPPVTIAPALRPTPPSAISRPVRAASSPPEDASRGLRINVPARAKINIEHERGKKTEEIEFQFKWNLDE